MKKFMVLYSGNVSEKEKASLSAADLMPKVLAWKDWSIKHAKDIVGGNGGPLGKTTRVDSSGAAPSKNNVGAYVVVQAENQEAAAAIFINHPHLSFFESNWIEIMEVLPLPSM